MGSHINWEDPEKPAEMNFERVVCFVLGGAGILIAAFTAITERSIGAFFYFGVILGIPLFLALIGRPRRWFVTPSPLETEGLLMVPWWKVWADPRSFYFGQAGFERLSKLDWALLSIMLPVSILVGYWAMPWLFPGTPRDWILVSVTALIATLFAGFFWQRPEMSRLPGVSGMAIACVAVYLLAWPGDLQNHLMSTLCALHAGVWTSIRYAFLLGLGRKAIAT